jgi:hypothetical protein
MADEAILREIPKPDKNFNPSGKSPPGGNKSNKFSPDVYAEKLLLEARQFLGWHQEYYKGGHNTLGDPSELAHAESVFEREQYRTLALHQENSGRPLRHLKV